MRVSPPAVILHNGPEAVMLQQGQTAVTTHTDTGQLSGTQPAVRSPLEDRNQ